MLSSAGPDAPPSGGDRLGNRIGDPLTLDDAFTESDPQTLSSLFGPDFARTVFALPVGVWSGPVRSAYGTHLVLISGRSEGAMRPFEDVRGAVAEARFAARQRALKAEYRGTLRAKYGVVWDENLRRFARTPPPGSPTHDPAGAPTEPEPPAGPPRAARGAPRRAERPGVSDRFRAREVPGRSEPRMPGCHRDG